MPTLKRQDNIQFAIHPYRELITAKKKPSLIKSEIRLLAKNHGQFVRLFQLNQNQIEGVFSTDPGYLLGETIWEYFHHSSDLIYCEVLPDKQHAILVIIRDNSVYLDSKISLDAIKDELSSLLASRNQYEIYTYGDVSLGLDSSHIKRFLTMDEPLLEKLPLNDKLQLQPLELAISSLKLNQVQTLIWISVAVVILMITLWWLMQPTEPLTRPIQAQTEPVSDLYASYHAALNGPTASEWITAIMEAYNETYSIPGWLPNKVQLIHQHIEIDVQPNGGTASLLTEWAKAHQSTFQYTQQGATLKFNPPFDKEIHKPNLLPAQQLLTILMDRINLILANPSVHLNSTQKENDLTATKVTVNFSDLAPTALSLISRGLYQLSVQITDFSATTQDGLLSGTIQLTLYGT